MNDEDDLPTKLKALHNAGQPLRRIAFITRLTMEEAEAKMQELGLKPRSRWTKVEPKAKQVTKSRAAQQTFQSDLPTRLPSQSEIIASTNWKINPTKYALNILSDRARYTPRGFTYDGQPIGSFALIRKANRVLKEAGQPQMDACWEWVIAD